MFSHLELNSTVFGWMQLIAWKDGDSKLLVDPEEIECLATIGKLNPNADSVDELYPDPSPIHVPGSVWNDVVLSPSRPTILSELRTAVKKVENQPIWKSWNLTVSFDLILVLLGICPLFVKRGWIQRYVRLIGLHGTLWLRLETLRAKVFGKM